MKNMFDVMQTLVVLSSMNAADRATAMGVVEDARSERVQLELDIEDVEKVVVVETKKTTTTIKDEKK